ncbi:melatonin receptor type 1B-A-like [Haliotis rufescens]|uniref:melatonin receptor type 1B-A-like n=1 Tax=Haliotis rufescens TaxID=6454 RepID=UPI001EB03FB8|nr:melatonin receptor type 1B-A-like [Haliotis rufescens]
MIVALSSITLDTVIGNVTSNCSVTAQNASDNGATFHRTALLRDSPVLAIIYICILSVALLLGVVGNAIVILVSWLVKSVNRVGKDFIVNLAIADLCVAGFADPMCIIGVVKGEEWFDDKLWFCQFIATACLTACFCAFLSLTLVSINRYTFVCHRDIYDKIYTRTACVVMCIFAWVIAFLFEFPNHVGWGGHVFDEKNHQCIWDRTASFSYTMVVSVGLIGSPLLLMCLCYILIFCHIYRTKVNIYRIDTDDPERMKKAWKETLRTSRTLFVVFSVFVVCWTPYAIVIALDVKDKMSMEVHLFATLLAHLHSSSNFVVYTICNRSFRSAVKKVIGCGEYECSSYRPDSKSTDVLKTSENTRKSVF